MASEEKAHVAGLGTDPKVDGSHSSDSELETLGAINEKRLLRKLDIRLLPAVSVLYLLSFLDRSNGELCSYLALLYMLGAVANVDVVANARIEGLTTDLKMTGNQYLTGLTLYFIGYVLFEVSCSILITSDGRANVK